MFRDFCRMFFSTSFSVPCEHLHKLALGACQVCQRVFRFQPPTKTPDDLNKPVKKLNTSVVKFMNSNKILLKKRVFSPLQKSSPKNRIPKKKTPLQHTGNFPPNKTYTTPPAPHQPQPKLHHT